MIYPEVDKLSVKTQSAYVEVRKTARKILKMYIGVNGKAKLFYGANNDLVTDITYLYNEGDECTSITGGWKILDETNTDKISYSKNSNCLEIKCTSVSADVPVMAGGFITVEQCMPFMKSYKIGIKYSFICDSVNDPNFYFTIVTGNGTELGTHIMADSSSAEIINTVYMTFNDDYSIMQLLVDLYWGASIDGYFPNTTLRIYKIWYEPNETE